MTTPKGKNIADVQRLNRTLVLKTIHRVGPTSRAEISEITGLNKATVTNIVNDLIQWGVVIERGLATGKSGRRTIIIEMATEKYASIGVWLTRRHFVVGIYDLYGRCRTQERFSVGINHPFDKLMSEMTVQVKKMIASCNDKKILGTALALPGPYIKREGKIALLTGRQDWQNLEIVNGLQDLVKTPLIAEHDTNAAVMAEWCKAYSIDGKDSILCIMVGQGVGAGLIENGEVITGSLGVAGEIGHMSIDYNGAKCECGNYGCLEQYCSTLAIQKQVHELAAGGFQNTECTAESTIHEIISAYKNNDQLARKVINEAAAYLGYGIANVVNLFNPGKVIIGDELSEAGDDFLKIIKDNVKKRVVPDIYRNMQISLSTLKDSVLTGATIYLFDELVKTPEVFQLDMETENLGDKLNIFQNLAQ